MQRFPIDFVYSDIAAILYTQIGIILIQFSTYEDSSAPNQEDLWSNLQPVAYKRLLEDQVSKIAYSDPRIRRQLS